MSISPGKENILKKIRKALSHPAPIPFPSSEGSQSVYHPAPEELEILFAEEFNKLQGRFVFCVNRQELAFQLNSLIRKQDWQKIFCQEEPVLQMSGLQMTERLTTDLSACDIAITGCEALVARTGTIVLSSAKPGGRTPSVFAPVHICVATTSQLVYDIKDALQLVKNKYGAQLPSLISFATGPSRTADIEKTLVVGVHGPKEVFLFLVDD